MSVAVPGSRDQLAAKALAHLPQILMQQDRNPASPTYGCFDRAFWHYRTLDFPCGMSQEFVLPLALAWALPMPDNPYFDQPAVRAWVEAGMRFAARAAHADGACDDYYPFERAAGAAAFSLFACLEAAAITGLEADPELSDFFARRARWLAAHRESGRLSNHEAIIIACLARMSCLDAAGNWEEALAARIERLRGWQSAEGWFDEYGGADPGYLTLTLAMLADADARRPDLMLRPMIARALGFLATMIHPDGSLGGEYTSRATVNFFPHGLEAIGGWEPLALAIADRGYCRFAAGVAPAYTDDRLVGHHVWSMMLAWRDWRPERPGPLALADGLIDYQEAGLRVQASGPLRVFAGLTRGGIFRLFDGEHLLRADTGPTLALTGDRTVVTHMPGATVKQCEPEVIEVEGPMCFAKTTRLTPLRSIVLRAVMLTGGRWFPDLVRRALQTILVTSPRPAPFHFNRMLRWEAGALSVTDTITPRAGWRDVRRAGLGGFQVSITTVMSRVWEPAQLQPFEDLTDAIADLAPNEPLVITRRYAAAA